MLFGKSKTYVMDYETLADPRVAQFMEFGLVSGKLLLPEPPNDPSAREDHRVRRAQEAIEKLRHVRGLSVKLDRKLLQRDSLIAVLRKQKATLITVNPELKTACDGLPVVTTSDIYSVFKPLYLPGAELRVRVTKRGKEKDEGIGYLEGGVKVVIENGARAMDRELEVVVQGALETDVGRVVFARPKFTDIK